MGKVAHVIVKDARTNAMVAAWTVKSDSAESDAILKLVTGEIADSVDGAQKALKRRGVQFEREPNIRGVATKGAAVSKSLEGQIEYLTKGLPNITDPELQVQARNLLVQLIRKQAEDAAGANVAGATAAAAAVASAESGWNDPAGARAALQSAYDGTAQAEDIDWSPEADEQMRVQLKKEGLHPNERDRIGYDLTLARLRALHRGERPW